MGDLDRDTALAGADGRYTASLSEDWRIWGPNGGYVAAIALRAAGAASRFHRPVSFACHFLGVGAFGPAEVAVTPLRTARAAESLRVVLAQEGRAFLEAQVWTGDVREGLVHDFATPPDVRPPTRFAPSRSGSPPRRPPAAIASGTTSKRGPRRSGLRPPRAGRGRRGCAAGIATSPPRASPTRSSRRRAR